MTTKFEQAEAIIKKVCEMRRFQKDYFATRDALSLRKAKELEKELDAMLDGFYGKQDTQKTNQLNIFQ